MTEFGNSIKSIRYTIASPTTATSGNLPLAFSAWAVTGRIIGLEVGSPAFGDATGSLYIIASGATWNQNRTVTLIKGIAQSRTMYTTSVYKQVEGQSLSGAVATAGNQTEHPLVDGDAIGLTGSGLFGGTGTFILFYQ